MRSDKGTKRKSYDSSRRKRIKELADIKRTVLAQQRAEALEKRRAQTEGKSKSQRRAEARLARLPKDLVCPACERRVLKSRQWVLDKDLQHTAICLSCYRKIQNGSLNV